MIFFLLLAITIPASAVIYIGRRLISPLPCGGKTKEFLRTLLILPFVLPPLAMLTRNRTGGIWNTTPLPWIAYLGMGFLSLVLTLLLCRDLVSGIFKITTRIIPLRRKETPEPPAISASNPGMANLVILVTAALLTLWGAVAANRTPQVREVPIAVRNLPAGFEGFRIVQISDLHAGPTIRRTFITRVVNRIRPLQPDMIVFTGDFGDGTVADLADDVAPLGELSAPYGMFFVTGNHEYYYGPEAWTSRARTLGFIPLINEHRVIRRGNDAIILAGVTDYSAGQFVPGQASNPAKALRDAPSLAVKILLAHQPRSIRAASGLGFTLQISGHTHGGQFIPWQPFILLQQPCVSGLHRFRETLVYTSRGTGYWGPPLRIGAPSEITVFTLTASP